MAEKQYRYWNNTYHESLVRSEKVKDEDPVVFMKEYGSTEERSIPFWVEDYEFMIGGDEKYETDKRTYDRGRLIPDAALYGKAVAFAIEHHGNQRRKDSHQTPYIAHLVAVSSLALEDGAIPDEAIAAILHDTVEDCFRTVSEDMLVEEFGEDVRRMVVGCTDRMPGEPRMNWRKRKERYLEHLAAAEDDVLLVSNADKLHNLMSFVADFQTMDATDVVERFGGGDGIRWYYTELGNIFADRRAGERNQLRFAANLEQFLDGIGRASDK